MFEWHGQGIFIIVKSINFVFVIFSQAVLKYEWEAKYTPANNRISFNFIFHLIIFRFQDMFSYIVVSDEIGQDDQFGVQIFKIKIKFTFKVTWNISG